MNFFRNKKFTQSRFLIVFLLQEVPVHVLPLVLHQLQWHYVTEYHRAMKGEGRWTRNFRMPQTSLQAPPPTAVPMDPKELKQVRA